MRTGKWAGTVIWIIACSVMSVAAVAGEAFTGKGTRAPDAHWDQVRGKDTIFRGVSGHDPLPLEKRVHGDDNDAPVIYETHREGGSVPAIPGPPLGARQQFLDAVRKGSLDNVKTWLAQGMDINARNESGEGALHVVRDPKVAVFLIQNGIDLEMRDDTLGMTPLFHHEIGIAKVLIDAGADVNARSHRGNTPLMWYAYSGYLEGIRYLAKRGADINARNYDGQTALDIAERFASQDVSNFLRSAGGRSGK